MLNQKIGYYFCEGKPGREQEKQQCLPLTGIGVAGDFREQGGSQIGTLQNVSEWKTGIVILVFWTIRKSDQCPICIQNIYNRFGSPLSKSEQPSQSTHCIFHRLPCRCQLLEVVKRVWHILAPAVSTGPGSGKEILLRTGQQSNFVSTPCSLSTFSQSNPSPDNGSRPGTCMQALGNNSNDSAKIGKFEGSVRLSGGIAIYSTIVRGKYYYKRKLF